MKKNIKAEVTLSLNKAGEPPQTVRFESEKVATLHLENDIMVLTIVGEDGMSISVKFSKDGPF